MEYSKKCMFKGECLQEISCEDCDYLHKEELCTIETSEEKFMSEYNIKEQQEAFKTGAVRDTQEGKGRFDLIEPEILFRVARLYETGANHYGDRNWEKGIPVSRCVSSALRHLVKYLAGWQDEDHLAAVIFNVGAIMRYEKHKREMCDLPWQKEQ